MKFSIWLKENGSINQSMPELDKEELPVGKMINAEPFSSTDDYPPTKFNNSLTVIAKQNARKWTKERIRRHTGLWRIEQEEKSVSCWPGEVSILLKNLNDGWSGWFPVKDISIV